MLVVGRKHGESIIIGNDIRITVVKSESGKTRLAIEAPKYMPISREEVYEEYKKKFD